MTREDKLFGRQIHDAYESVELSDEAQDRILANLLAARGARQESQAEVSEEEREVEVHRLPWRRGRWAFLPVAAGLVAALAVVQIGTLTFRESGSSHAYSIERSKDEESSASESVAYDVAEETDAAADMAASAAPQADEERISSEEAESAESMRVPLPDFYPDVTTRDGLTFTARAEQVDASRVKWELGDAVASSPDGQELVACTVYELVDGGHAVRYDEDDRYWLCE